MAIDVSKAWIGRTTHQNQRPRRIRHRGPTFAPSLRRWAASLPVRSRRRPGGIRHNVSHLMRQLPKAVDQRPGLFNVPWPLPPRAFSQSRVEAPSPELIVPLPLHAAAYVSDVGLTTAVPPRSYLPASVGATLEGAARAPAGLQRRPLSVDAALSEIEAEVYARTTTVEAAIAQVRLDRQTERLQGTAPRADRHAAHNVGRFRASAAVTAWTAGRRSGFATCHAGIRNLGPRTPRLLGASPSARLGSQAPLLPAWLALVLLLIIAYRFINPPISALMLQRWVFWPGESPRVGKL